MPFNMYKSNKLTPPVAPLSQLPLRSKISRRKRLDTQASFLTIRKDNVDLINYGFYSSVLIGQGIGFWRK
jgi:hypothetical protein